MSNQLESYRYVGEIIIEATCEAYRDFKRDNGIENKCKCETHQEGLDNYCRCACHREYGQWMEYELTGMDCNLVTSNAEIVSTMADIIDDIVSYQISFDGYILFESTKNCDRCRCETHKKAHTRRCKCKCHKEFNDWVNTNREKANVFGVEYMKDVEDNNPPYEAKNRLTPLADDYDIVEDLITTNIDGWDTLPKKRREHVVNIALDMIVPDASVETISQLISHQIQLARNISITHNISLPIALEAVYLDIEQKRRENDE